MMSDEETGSEDYNLDAVLGKEISKLVGGVWRER